MKEMLKNIIIGILTWQARMLLAKHRPKIVAVTGSVGKTSTKDAIYAALKNSVSARKTEKSFNTEIGVPLTVLGLSDAGGNGFLWLKNILEGFFTLALSKEYPKVLVLEAGIDRPGDMAKLTKWMKPNIVVLTRLAEVPTHVEFFDSPEAVVTEKMKLVSALISDGVFIYNKDDTVIEAQLSDVRQKQVSFSRYLAADINTSGDQTVYQDNVPQGTQFTVSHNDVQETIKLDGTVGSQHVYACSAALAVALELGIPFTEAVSGLQSLKTPRGRMRILPGLKSSVLIDDSYNSSPIAASSALETLSELRFAKRKIAVLGDMLELGKYASEQHFSLGKQAAGVADMLIAVGVRSRKIVEGALSAGMDEAVILQYDESEQAGKELQNLLEPGDYVLIKASQSIRVEKIVEEVMAEPEKADELLVRRGKAWNRR